MLTLNEALDRAGRIWAGPMSVQLRPDGGADVALTRLATHYVGTRRACPFSYHRLDANGHAVCHNDCADFEAALT